MGTSETVSEFGDLFATLARKQKIYQSKEDLIGARPAVLGRFLPSLTTVPAAPKRVAGKPVAGKTLPLRELTEQALLQHVIHAGALVDNRGDILYLHGRTGMYLEPAPGESGVNNMLKMAREGLRHELAMALNKTVATKETSYLPRIRVKTNGGFSTVNLTVCLVDTTLSASSEIQLYLVILEQVPEPVARKPVGTTSSGEQVDVDADARITELKQELRATDEYLQTTIEELETSNEELRSSNEEMQSVNEELQSTNEELETSKEELQSVNEELATVNAELQTKVADLSRTNNDMNNLLAGTGIATVFVDHQLRIMRFTPTATKIINLIQSDIGRPVSHIVPNMPGYSTLTADIQAVLDTLMPKESEVQTTEGKWYTMRILPYRTLDNVIVGAVLTFVDITAVRKLREELRTNEERLRVALSSTSIVLFNQDTDLRYTWIYNPNPGFKAEQVIGKTDAELLPEKDAAILLPLKQQVLETGRGVREYVPMTVEGKANVVVLTIEPLHDPAGVLVGLTCASLDVTGQHCFASPEEHHQDEEKP
jgi:two-component system, chemotaxis family, CheB/CheR fusion protein